MIGRNCKACQAKDAHIQSLERILADYRSLLIPPRVTNPSLVEMEQDAILSARQEPIKLTNEEYMEQQKIESEADSILSGTY